MEYRKLGRTDLDVSIVGLGTEYLHGQSQGIVISVMHEAIEAGVNYFDLVYAFPEYRDHLGAALKGHRDNVLLAGHMGSAETKGQYRLTRDLQECEALFLDLLSRLHTEYVDILMIQLVDTEADYERIVRPGGVMDLARRFQREGKARFIGLSGHKVPIALRTAQSGLFDVLMFPINLAWDVTPGRKDAIRACALHNVGLVAMKPFAGSRLLKPRGSKVITPAQCLAYVLSQEGVSTAVPGVRNTPELRAALHVLDATDEEKDVRGVLADFQEDLRGNCLYCNHCLPCPVGIDIAQILRNVDKVLYERSDEVQAAHEAYQETVDFFHPDGIRSSDTEYEVLTAKASSCTECGVCMKRCPFGVDVVSKMKQAVELFETEKGA